MLGLELENDIPVNDYYEYSGPEYKLHISPKQDVRDENTAEYLNYVRTKAILQMKQLQGAPSVDTLNLPIRDDFFNADSFQHRTLSRPEHPSEIS